MVDWCVPLPDPHAGKPIPHHKKVPLTAAPLHRKLIWSFMIRAYAGLTRCTPSPSTKRQAKTLALGPPARRSSTKQVLVAWRTSKCITRFATSAPACVQVGHNLTVV
eukprot:scaffold66078_cov18-Tisochrysis_lutea.AAC.1